MFQNLKPEVKILVIVALIAVVLSVVGVLLLKTMQPSPIVQAPSPQPQTLDTSDGSTSLTAGWQTYSNDEFGFELKYPLDWFIYDDGNFPCEYVLLSKKQLSDCYFADYIPADFYVFKSEPYDPFPQSSKSDTFQPFTVDGEDAVINFATEKSDGPRGKDTKILVNNSGYGYMISFSNTDYQGNHEQVFDQILSTFKFTSRYTELDGKVWNDVNQIVAAVNIYYAEMERLPRSLEELTSLPDLSFFRVNKNPITGKSYIYTLHADGKSFVVSGTQSNGTEYTREFSVE